MSSKCFEWYNALGVLIAAACVAGLVVSEVRYRVKKTHPCAKCKDASIFACLRCAETHTKPPALTIVHDHARPMARL